MSRSYYVVVPLAAKNPTKWHPTESTGPFARLTRGVFASVAAAHTWGQAHLDGHPYEIRRESGSLLASCGPGEYFKAWNLR